MNTPSTGLNYNNFSTSNELAFNGNAIRTEGSIELAIRGNNAGSVFHKTPITVNSNTSFQTQFQFKLFDKKGKPNGDGFTFVLQNSSAGADALGERSGNLGYGSIPKSLAIEFDTFQNPWDESKNQISVLRNGDAQNALATVTPTLNLNSGNKTNAWIDYNGLTQTLEVFISSSATKPATPVLSYTVGLASIVGTQAYVGFTASTSQGRNSHHINSWQFLSYQPNPDTTSPTAVLVPPETVIGGSTYDFTITYGDDSAVNVGTIGSGDVTIIGPRGFRQDATLLKVSGEANSPYLSATYRITAPGGVWDRSDNGIYRVLLKDSQIADIAGNYAQGTEIGTFRVGLTPLLKNGGAQSQTLKGDAQNNVITGRGGHDVLMGLGGNDTIFGGLGNDTLNGGDGIDTVSYADASTGVVADLGQGKASRIARIMPVGDSITFGVKTLIDPGQGGYRRALAELLETNQIAVDFVGSVASRADGLKDLDHEGYSGKTIDWFIPKIQGFVKAAAPDVVLLMLGTNDIVHSTDTIQTMLNELTQVLNRIASVAPDSITLVAGVPPVSNTLADFSELTDRVNAYNSGVANLVNARKQAGKKVGFVDLSSLTSNDIHPVGEDNGLHPTNAGYNKLANIWLNALSNLGVDQGTFSVDKDVLIDFENLTGSAFNDVLFGDGNQNIIEGGLGQDTLTGNGGPDIFVYRSPQDGGDIIKDFAADDIFQIHAKGFSSDLLNGFTLSETSSPTGVLVNSNMSLGAEPTFLYANRILSFDIDGTGARDATVLAELTNGPATLNVNQFNIVV